MTSALYRGEHRAATAWRLGCRCDRCRAGLRRQAKVWRATRVVRRGGDPATHVAAAKVRRRIIELEAAGWTRSRIAAAAGVAPVTVTRVAKRTTRWCSRIVASGVLGLQP